MSRLGLPLTLRKLGNKFTYLIGRIFEEKRWEYTYEQYRRKYEISPTFSFIGPGIALIGNGRIVLQGPGGLYGYSRIQS